MLPEKEKSNKTREWGDGHGERWEGAKDSLQLTETKEQKTLISVCFVLNFVLFLSPSFWSYISFSAICIKYADYITYAHTHLCTNYFEMH